MRAHNIEILTPDFAYRSSFQVNTGKVEYREDYLSLENSKVVVPKITAKEGDYIRITGDTVHTGIVTSCEERKKDCEIQWKPILSITDVQVHFDRSLLKTWPLEEWLAYILNSTFRTNEDSLQNITGFRTSSVPATYNAILDLEENIGNLYEIIKEILLKYSITVDFYIDMTAKTLRATIVKRTADPPVIEADLPNVLEKSFLLKQSDGATNKLTIYNQLDETEYISYYLLQDGTITTNKDATGRITPVIFDTVFIEHESTDEETFTDMAYEKAFSSLAPEDYNNLIELTVLPEDDLINPRELQIGQKVNIVHDGQMYSTVLTGKIEEKTIKLIFGGVRLELTKILKRRMNRK